MKKCFPVPYSICPGLILKKQIPVFIPGILVYIVSVNFINKSEITGVTKWFYKPMTNKSIFIKNSFDFFSEIVYFIRIEFIHN